MKKSVINLIAVAERSEGGYADVPPGSISDEIEGELAEFGYAVGLSDRMWVGGYRVYSPESVGAGNYRLHVPATVYARTAPQFAYVPDAGEFAWEAVLGERGEIQSN